MIDADTDDDNYRPSKRTRADFKPPTMPRSFDDTDAMQSSPGRSQRGHSREDVHMTDQTDDEPYEVSSFSLALVFKYLMSIEDCHITVCELHITGHLYLLIDFDAG